MPLPIHPTLTHPLTGMPLTAVGFRRDGRAIWPIIGASESDDAAAAAAEAAKAAADKAAADAAAAKSDKGFPEGTPVAEMTAEQQVAYWKDKAQTHEGRNKSLLKITGGKHGDDLKAEFDELEKLRDTGRTTAEKAVEQARKDALAQAQSDFGPKLARLAFESALAHVEDDTKRSELIDALNLTSVITADGDIDTAKVRSIANTIAPTAKGAGTQRHDYGGGNRGGQQATGVSAGADLFAATRKKPITNS